MFKVSYFLEVLPIIASKVNITFELTVAATIFALIVGVIIAIIGYYKVLNTIKSLAEEGTTMILVTHEIGFAREVASRILFMDGGRIAADGRPEEIIDHPENQRLQQFLNFVNRK